MDTCGKTNRITVIACIVLCLTVLGFAFVPQGQLQADEGGAAVLESQENQAIDQVREAIQGLSANPTAFTAEDIAEVTAIEEAFNALSDEDRATLDAECSHGETQQPLGRVLEGALWAVWSYEEIDNTTTLPDGIYDASSNPALSSAYSKGKSTSTRQKPWSVKSVEVVDGLATATILVESDTYTALWSGGVTYDLTAINNKNCEFAGVPIDLNNTFYFAGVSSIMPLPIPFLLETEIEEPEQVDPTIVFTVTFTDGEDNVLAEVEVQAGESAVWPFDDDPVREGFVFRGWDRPLDNITEDTTINAEWSPEGTHRVQFFDGWGNLIDKQDVKEGEAAVAPDDPVYEGYTFTGWDPADFDDIQDDLTVTATWVNNKLLAAKTAIADLVKDADGKGITPKDVLRDVGNERVSAAAVAYEALSEELRKELTKDELLTLARFAIAVLPSDAFAVTNSHATAINRAKKIYDSLPEDLQTQLDSGVGESINSSVKYGRYLENAAWALDSLHSVNNVTLLKSGTYNANQLEWAFSMGKSKSDRAKPFSIKSVIVEGGRSMALIEHDSNTSQFVRIGGVNYENLQTDPSKHSQYKIPINLHSTFHFSYLGKNATADTEAIAYEMTVSANESTMVPDKDDGKKADDKKTDNGSTSSSSSGSSSKSGSSSSGGTKKSTKSNASSGSGALSANNSSNDDAANNNSSTSNTSSSGKLSASNSTSSGTTSSALQASNSKTSSSAASSSKAASKTDKNATASAADGKRSVASDGPSGVVSEVAVGESEDGLPYANTVDLRPAIAGGVLLCIALGIFGFVLRFVRRESSFV